MKIIPLNNKTKLKDLVEKAKKDNRFAQKELFDLLSPSMLSVCRTYIKDLHYAEDVMIKAFFKIFQKLKQGIVVDNIQAYTKRAMINESIDFIRTQKEEIEYKDELIPDEEEDDLEEIQELDFDIQSLLDKLPSGYRAVFNLYVIEEYKHKEIAEMLSISESTSKTQLMKAKKMLVNLFREQKNYQNEKRYN
ncbi:MAG: RNA polymerase sigma factor [Flavobacteriales bacterium]|nr:RNA polymerase sigma factor [Flavobacteriales bacterium]